MKRIEALIEAVEAENSAAPPDVRALQVLEALWNKGITLERTGCLITRHLAVFGAIPLAIAFGVLLPN